MSAQSVWRRWRRDVHNILEVGGEAHPLAYFVNAFIIMLIVVNAIAFAAETVPSVAAKYGAGLDHFNNNSVSVFTIEYILRVWSAVDIPMLMRMPHWRARLRFMLRPIMIIDLTRCCRLICNGLSRSTSESCVCCASSVCSKSRATRLRCRRWAVSSKTNTGR